MEETLYSKIVELKKKVYKTPVVPKPLRKPIDSFFNGVHGAIILSKDRIGDAFIVTKDITKNAFLKTGTLSKQANRHYMSKFSFVSYLLFPVVFTVNFLKVMCLSFKFRKYGIDEHSDKDAVNNVDKIIVNSRNVRNRVKRFYKKDSIVVNPPIETKSFRYKKNGNFWLSVNRLTPEKRVEMQIEAFNKLPEEKIIIVGGFDSFYLEYINKLKKLYSKNIVFSDCINEHDLIELYETCKGFITTSKDEDFGMTVVEAMAAGKPVIAPNEGGYKETIINGKTGILIDDILSSKIVDAVREISKNPEKYKLACLKQAKKFDTKIFIKKIKTQIRYL